MDFLKKFIACPAASVLFFFILFSCSPTAKNSGDNTINSGDVTLGSLKKIVPISTGSTLINWGISTTAKADNSYKKFQLLESKGGGTPTPVDLSGLKLTNEKIFDLTYFEGTPATPKDISTAPKFVCLLQNDAAISNLFGGSSPPNLKEVSPNRGEYISTRTIGGSLYCFRITTSSLLKQTSPNPVTLGVNSNKLQANSHKYVSIFGGLGKICALATNSNVDCFQIDGTMASLLLWNNDDNSTLTVKTDSFITQTSTDRPTPTLNVKKIGNDVSTQLSYLQDQKNKNFNDEVDCFLGNKNNNATYCIYTHYPELSQYLAIGNYHICAVTNDGSNGSKDTIQCMMTDANPQHNLGQLGWGYKKNYLSNNLYTSYVSQYPSSKILSIGAGGYHTCFVERVNSNDGIKCFGYNFAPYVNSSSRTNVQTFQILSSLDGVAINNPNYNYHPLLSSFTAANATNLVTKRGVSTTDSLKIYDPIKMAPGSKSSNNKHNVALHSIFSKPTAVNLPSDQGKSLFFQNTSNNISNDQYRIFTGQTYTCVQHANNPMFMYNDTLNTNCFSPIRNDNCTKFDGYMLAVNNKLKENISNFDNKNAMVCFGDLSDFFQSTNQVTPPKNPNSALANGNTFLLSNNIYFIEGRFSTPYVILNQADNNNNGYSNYTTTPLSVNFNSCKNNPDIEQELCGAYLKTGFISTASRTKSILSIPRNTLAHTFFLNNTTGSPTSDTSGTKRYIDYLVGAKKLWLPNIDVTAGDAHTCTLRVDGTAMCWGDNRFCQISGTKIGDKNTSSDCGYTAGAFTPKPDNFLFPPTQISVTGASVVGVYAGRDGTCVVSSTSPAPSSTNAADKVSCQGTFYNLDLIQSGTITDTSIKTFKGLTDLAVGSSLAWRKAAFEVSDAVFGVAPTPMNNVMAIQGYPFTPSPINISSTSTPPNDSIFRSDFLTINSQSNWYYMYTSYATFSKIFSNANDLLDSFGRNKGLCVARNNDNAICKGTAGNTQFNSDYPSKMKTNSIAFTHAAFGYVTTPDFALNVLTFTPSGATPSGAGALASSLGYQKVNPINSTPQKSNAYDPLTLKIPALSVTAGVRHFCALDVNGVVTCYGDLINVTTSTPTGTTNYLKYNQLGEGNSKTPPPTTAASPNRINSNSYNSVNTMIDRDN